MITEDQYNDMEMASLAFVPQEAFGHPEIEEVMREVFDFIIPNIILHLSATCILLFTNLFFCYFRHLSSR